MRAAESGQGGAAVGLLLREWRTARGVSQLDLAMRAGFSARHVSFIETGRSQPSRQAVLVLAEALDVPLRDRNRLLEAGGYARVYRQTPLDAEDMRHIRGVAPVHPRSARAVRRGGARSLLEPAHGERGVAGAVPDDRRSRADRRDAQHHAAGLPRVGTATWIVNWPEVAEHLLSRCERELGGPSADETSRALLADIRGLAGPSATARHAQPLKPADVLLPVHIRRGEIDVRLFSTIMTLGTPQDVTLQELRIETFFPADPESERTIRAMGKRG